MTSTVVVSIKISWWKMKKLEDSAFDGTCCDMASRNASDHSFFTMILAPKSTFFKNWHPLVDGLAFVKLIFTVVIEWKKTRAWTKIVLIFHLFSFSKRSYWPSENRNVAEDSFYSRQKCEKLFYKKNKVDDVFPTLKRTIFEFEDGEIIVWKQLFHPPTTHGYTQSRVRTTSP